MLSSLDGRSINVEPIEDPDAAPDDSAAQAAHHRAMMCYHQEMAEFWEKKSSDAD